MAYERIAVVGNIGSIEALPSRQGNMYIRMSVAVDRGYGENKNVVWYSVLLFGAMAQDPDKVLARYRKGRLILVEGRPQVEAFIKSDGRPGLDNTIVAISLPELLDHKVA
jgi:single-stranded DNA-binding protein